MVRVVAAVAFAAVSMVISSGVPARAADLVWQVENTFPSFLRIPHLSSMYERGYPVARDAASPPNDVVWRTERRLNDPDCKTATNFDTCAATARGRYDASRLGWAAQTVDAVCYDSRQGRYLQTCDRRYSWGTAKEDYILPEAHTVIVKLAPAHLAAVARGECTWTGRRASRAARARPARTSASRR
jgi:hypothetical protein